MVNSYVDLLDNEYCVYDYFMSYQDLIKYKTPHQVTIIKKNKSLQWNTVPKSIGRVLRNQILCLPFFFGLLFLHTKLNMNFSWIFKPHVIFDTVMFLMLLDLVFYSFHRLCHHNKWLFKNVHKDHHEWVISMAVGTLDMSIPDCFLTIIIPMYSSLLINSNVISLLLGIIYATFSIVFAHCGYYIPMVNTNKHDIHHIYYKCNYSSIWDRPFGTLRKNKF